MPGHRRGGRGKGKAPFLKFALSVGNNLNQVVRALNTRRSLERLDLVAAVDDARAIATTVAAELAMMTRDAATARRGEAG